MIIADGIILTISQFAGASIYDRIQGGAISPNFGLILSQKIIA